MRLENPIELEFFEIALLGLPLAAIGVIYMVLFSKLLLPPNTTKRKYIPVVSAFYDVPGSSKYVGQILGQTDISDIPGVVLVRIATPNTIETGVGVETTHFLLPAKTMTLEEGDILYFVGVPECIENIHDLRPNTTKVLTNIALFECQTSKNTVSDQLTLVDFMDRFGCRIVRVNRSGKIVDMSEINNIEPDDILTVEAEYSFLQYARLGIFESINEVLPIVRKSQSKSARILYPIIVLTLFVAMIVLAVTNVTTLFSSAGAIICIFILIRIVNWDQSVRSVNANIIVLIACSFSLSLSLSKTTVSSRLASMLGIFNTGTYTLLLGIYLITNLLSAVISNVAAASIMFPIVVMVTEKTGLNLKAALYTLMISASYAFITPIGYQTNLMVQEEGEYSWLDFVKFGGPLTVIYIVVTPAIAMGIWR